MSDKERTKISNILRKKRLQGKTSGMWKDVGIKYLGDNGLWDKMLDWEKEYYFLKINKTIEFINEKIE